MNPIKAYRKKHKIKAKDLAEKLDVHPVYLAYIESGARIPSRKLAKRIERVTDGEIGKMQLLFPEE